MRETDKRMLVAALRQNKGFHLATKWYLREFEPLPYQWAWHHITMPETNIVIPNTTIIAGIAAGKTSIEAASYLIDCVSIPYFRALSTSITAKQSQLPFDMAMSWIEHNDRMEPLIENIKLRPYPVIDFKNGSQWEFRTSGLDARYIRGSEYDRACFDEAGLDPMGNVVKVLRGRLRGTRPDGANTPRMARLDVITSPTDAPWLKERFYKGWKGSENAELDTYRSIRVATWDNTRLTELQIEAMKSEYPPDMIDVEMGGMFPDYGYSMFPSSAIESCTDIMLYDGAYEALFPESGKPMGGYDIQEDPRHGIFKFETPRRPNRIYVSAADPGSDVIPKRNSGCVIVMDVTDPNNMIMVYFHWVSGKGSYNPFLESYKYAISKYNPILKGIDATGPQKALDEIAFQNVGIETDKIAFNTEKPAALNMLKTDITNGKMRWPPIKGLKRQLGIYTDEYDRRRGAQDIVMTLCQISYLMQFVPQPGEDTDNIRHVYRNRKARV